MTLTPLPPAGKIYREPAPHLFAGYYFAGAQRVAALAPDASTGVRERYPQGFGANKVSYLLSDHPFATLRASLGSASVTYNASTGAAVTQLYKPWGEVRYASGALPTKYTYTGQYSNTADFGLMYYRARWYDPALGRFAQADTVVPGAGNPMAWDRYAYVLNNPVLYADPDGHFPILPLLVIGLITIAIAGDTVSPEAQAESQAHAAAVVGVNEIANKNSPNAVNGMAEMFTSDKLAGNTPQSRLETILLGTNSGPLGQQFRVRGGGGGFAPHLDDGTGGQMGHFLTAVGLGYDAGSSAEKRFFNLSAIIGHEMTADGGGSGFVSTEQVIIGAFNQDLHHAFLSGTDADFQAILDRGFSHPLAGRQGNSIEDLRLSYLGWVLGQMIANGEFRNREDVANWIRDNIGTTK